MADAQLVRDLRERIERLEALLAADPVIERIQRLEMRVGGLQGQLNALKAKAPVAPPDAPYEGAQAKNNAAAG